MVSRSSTLFRNPFILWNSGLGLIVLVVLLTLVSFSACTSGGAKQVSSPSEKEFTNPGIAYRPMALWTWRNGYVDTLNLVYELEEMKDKGMRGALIWDLGALINPDDIIPAGPSFLGPESREYISLALKTADSLGLDMGISSASSWNSGGGWVPKENASMELLNSRKILKGPTTFRVPTGEEPQSERGTAEHCTHFTTLAYPKSQAENYDHEEVIILSSSMKEGEYMEWQVPDGEWEVMSFFRCNTMQSLVVPSPNSSGLIIDHLSKEATEQHFDELFSRLDKANHKEHPMKFVFLDSDEVWQAMDWTSSILKEFQARYEYDPKPYLPLLQGQKHKNPSIYNGAVVVGRKPQKTTTLKGFPEADEEVKAIADKIWGECDGQKVFSNTYGKGTVYWGQPVKEILEEGSILQDLKVEGIENHDLQIDFVHRRSDSEEIYFVSNSSEEKKEITCAFRVDRSLIPELWDAETGLVQKHVTYTKTKNGIQLNLNLSPLASRFVVFKKKDRSSTETEFLPNLQFGFPEDKDNSGKQVSIDLSNTIQ